MIFNRSNDRKKPNKHRLSGFALPTILIASIIMLSVLLVSVASTVAMRVSLSAQTYNQLAGNAGDAGLVYAKACLDASGGVPTWTDANPLTPSTDCSGNQLPGFTCPDGTADSRCAVTVNGGAIAQVLVVGGGGGGGGTIAGGGGGGGLIYNSTFSFTPQAYTVTVGFGGTGATGYNTAGQVGGKGGDSIFSSLTAYGSGGGGGWDGYPPSSGGSGGGGAGNVNNPPTTNSGTTGVAGQGNNGGNGSSVDGWGGGGGGAGAVGVNGTNGAGGAGGVGKQYDISGTNTYYAGGGGGGTRNYPPAGAGGLGGGGAGSNTSVLATDGTANTGSGGGGAGYTVANSARIGGNGGSGVVIISYPTGSITATVTGGTTTTLGGNTIQTFTNTSGGTFTVTATTANSSPVVSTFSVGLPTLINGKANEINSVGSSKLLKSSDNTVWRRYNQSSRLTIPAVVIIDPSGDDGAITVVAGKNINTDFIATGRTCADAVNYSITTLTTNSATLSTIPTAGCLVAGDEILLINLQGISTNYANVGNYETIRILSISTNVITFSTNKTKYYGNGASDDTNIGTAATNQRVMLQRVPNYTNVTINSGITLTANAWDGVKGGVMMFKATGTVSVPGIINMAGKGWRGGIGLQWYGGAGESYNGGPIPSSSSSVNANGGGAGGANSGQIMDGQVGCGGGAGYATAGTNGGTGRYGYRGYGGGVYGVADLSKIYFGSGGGGSANVDAGSGASGGNGGGIIMIYGGSAVSVTGAITANGGDGTTGLNGHSAASGGSIYLNGVTVSVGNNLVTALGGLAGNAQNYITSVQQCQTGPVSSGRIRAVGTFTGTTNPTAYNL